MNDPQNKGQSIKEPHTSENGSSINDPLPKNFIGEKDWFILYNIAFYKALNKNPISTAELSENINFSQQTISRRTIELEERGFIHKLSKNRTNLVEPTAQGYLQLQKVFNNLDRIFEHESYSNKFSGILKTGFGEGAYYIQKDQYLAQFEEKLGFKPYFGTLNVQIQPEVYELLIEGQNSNNVKPIKIEGFKDNQREFGQVQCYRAEIWPKNREHEKVHGALLRIHRTAHKKHILEFISKYYLREKFKLQDDDIVYFQFEH